MFLSCCAPPLLCWCSQLKATKAPRRVRAEVREAQDLDGPERSCGHCPGQQPAKHPQAGQGRARNQEARRRAFEGPSHTPERGEAQGSSHRYVTYRQLAFAVGVSCGVYGCFAAPVRTASEGLRDTRAVVGFSLAVSPGCRRPLSG